MTPRSRSSRFICSAGIVIGTSAFLIAQTPRQERPGGLRLLPLTQLDERVPAPDLDNRSFTLTFAQAVPIKDLLLLLVRGTSLSIVPDPSVNGSFIGELKNVTVRQALVLILQPLGLDFAVDGTVVRVFSRERETRLFDINYLAVDRSLSVRAGGESGAAHGGARVTTNMTSNVFGELENGVRTLVSDRGAFNLDRQAGLLQVTDFPERLQRIGAYLEAAQDRLHRQVQIDVKVVQIELRDGAGQTIDWDAVIQRISAVERSAARLPSLAGVRATNPQAVLDALREQGTVSVLNSPRFVTLNNQPAIVRTDAMSISVTPQIGLDAVMLDVSPIVERPAIAESDMMARVTDGETLVVQGFTRDRAIRARAGGIGGWVGRKELVARSRAELVVLITPKILGALAAQ